jgi:hypothetical protein
MAMTASTNFKSPLPGSNKFEQYVNQDIENILKKIHFRSRSLKYQNYDPAHPKTLTSLWHGTLKMKIHYTYNKILDLFLFVLRKYIYGFYYGFRACSTYHSFRSHLEEGRLIKTQNRVTKITKKFLNSIGSEIPSDGVCRGETDLFNYLFFATKGIFNCEESQLIAIAKSFIKGASIAPAIMQTQLIELSECEPTLSDLSLVVSSKGDRKNNLTEAIKSLSNGAYSVCISTYHGVWFLKRDGFSYIFDPNIGLIKIGSSAEEVADRLLMIDKSLHLFKGSFAFSLSKGKTMVHLTSKGSWQEMNISIKEIQPRIMMVKQHNLIPSNHFQDIIFRPINFISHRFNKLANGLSSWIKVKKIILGLD